jgi:hypothetical protein
MSSRCKVALCLLLAIPAVARAWEFELPSAGDDHPTAVAITPQGDVLVAASFGRRADMLRLRGADGTLVWRKAPLGDGGVVLSLATIGDDALVSAYSVEQVIGAYPHAVIRLSGATGDELWRDVDGNQAVVDGHGDVFDVHRTNDDIEVRKLDGVMGTELWRHPVSSAEPSNPLPVLAVDPDGDVVVAATAFDKLDGVTGAPIWHVPLPFDSFCSVLRIGFGGDVVAETEENPSEPGTRGRAALTLQGRDGAVRWRQPREQDVLDVTANGNVAVGRISGNRVGTNYRARWHASIAFLDSFSSSQGRVWHLGALEAPILLDARAIAGADVLASVVTGALEGRPSVARVMRLRGEGRHVAWAHGLGRVPGTDVFSLVPQVAHDGLGRVVAAWVRHRRATGYDLRVVTLLASTGRADSGSRD